MRAFGVTSQEASVPYMPKEALGPPVDVFNQCIYTAIWENDRPGPEYPGGENFQGSSTMFAQVRPELASAKEAAIVAWARQHGRVRGSWRVIRGCPGDPLDGTLVAFWQGDLPSVDDEPPPQPWSTDDEEPWGLPPEFGDEIAQGLMAAWVGGIAIAVVGVAGFYFLTRKP